jgi:transposase
MDTLDQIDMKERYLVVDNVVVHKVNKVQELIASRGYKVAYLSPYLLFLNPIELFWSKIKGNIRRDCISVDDNLSLRITEAAKKVTQEDCANWISHSQSFFDTCLTLEPMLYVSGSIGKIKRYNPYIYSFDFYSDFKT